MNRRKAAETLAALAHPARLAIYRALVEAGDGGKPVGEGGLSAGRLATEAKLSPSQATFHLGVLHSAGLVSWRGQGRSSIYEAQLGQMNALLSFLIEVTCQAREEVVEVIRDFERQPNSRG